MSPVSNFRVITVESLTLRWTNLERGDLTSSVNFMPQAYLLTPIDSNLVALPVRVSRADINSGALRTHCIFRACSSSWHGARR